MKSGMERVIKEIGVKPGAMPRPHLPGQPSTSQLQEVMAGINRIPGLLHGKLRLLVVDLGRSRSRLLSQPLLVLEHLRSGEPMARSVSSGRLSLRDPAFSLLEDRLPRLVTIPGCTLGVSHMTPSTTTTRYGVMMSCLEIPSLSRLAPDSTVLSSVTAVGAGIM